MFCVLLSPTEIMFFPLEFRLFHKEERDQNSEPKYSKEEKKGQSPNFLSFKEPRNPFRQAM